MDAVRVAEERIGRIETAIEEFLGDWPLAPVVRALQALRAVELVVAVTFVTEIGDIRRFDNPRQLMGYLGLVPSERSSGDTVRRGGITKAGNGQIRHMLVESAWTYRHPPRVGKTKPYRLEQTTPKVREIAWKAQSRNGALSHPHCQGQKDYRCLCGGFPPDGFYPVRLLRPEDVHHTRERVGAVLRLHQRRERVRAFAEVHRRGRHHDPRLGLVAPLATPPRSREYLEPDRLGAGIVT